MYKYIVVKHFKKQLKPYAKKFINIISDVKRELIWFDKNRAVDLGNHIYKIRLSTVKLKRGKSKSFRLIIYIFESDYLITPIAIYIKNKQKNIKPKEIKYHLNRVFINLKKI